MRSAKPKMRPNSGELEQEWQRVRYRHRYNKILRSTIGTLIAVAAGAVLMATFWMPVLQIYGSSMTPSLEDGQIVLAVKEANLKQGDIVGFYCNNKILVKRVIGCGGDLIDIDEEGTVFVNDEELSEPYLMEKSLGLSDVEFPCLVPQERIFVMGDQRDTSVDSRNSAVGFVAPELIVGKIVFCVWPLERFGWVGQGD